ncbi:MAG: ribonuclease HII [Gammaproteobacteria bacterium]|nr:ribonuclease HII [Gammaproteobacteria bacterium]
MNSDLLLAGVDEAGRGPLVGSVVAAAVILNPDQPVAGLADSKKLSEKKREALAVEIKASVLAWSIASVSAAEIDEINILQATMKAMKLAVEGLSIAPEKVEVDGNRCPDIAYPVEAIIKGDDKVQAISAASILAKVERDHQMLKLHQDYPQYGFDRHKGYGTKVHIAALQAHGACPDHRRSFAPVKKVL